MIVFDGYAFAQAREAQLKQRVLDLVQRGQHLKIAAILFVEDTGSQLYTRLKKEAAERVGIGYEVHAFSMIDPVEDVLAKLNSLNNEAKVTGIIIQKPWKARWEEVQKEAGVENPDFADWWHQLVSHIAEEKDVDGLHPSTLIAIEQGNRKEQGRVLPATPQAVLHILQHAEEQLAGQIQPFKQLKTAVLGKSDILGKPLFYELKNQGWNVEMLGRKELEARLTSGQKLKDFDIIISGTGRAGLVTGELVKNNLILVDVGEPKPDVMQHSVEEQTLFLTPVPGGVGPVTVVSLLDNLLVLVEHGKLPTTSP